MKNLKRALSFALASVMLIGMMVVGAGAAEFTDANDIVNKDAVNTMVALNVLSGKEDGSFYDPTGTLTRAEAAKMVVFLLHGGKAPVIGTKTNPTFSDIDNTWAEEYIEYCAATGILAGKGDGTFGPTDKLTGSAFAKMLLVAMDYDAKIFGLVGNDWETNTNVEANKASLYEDLETLLPGDPISRDDAAQMLFNALEAGTMVKSWTQNGNGEITQNYRLDTAVTLLGTKFQAVSVEGGVVTSVTPVTSGVNKGTFNITTTDSDDADVTADTFTKVTADYTALLGQTVKVIYKDTDKVYGVYATDDNTVVEGLERNIETYSATEVKISGTKYKLESLTSLVDTVSSPALQKDTNSFRTFKLIDNDGDNKYEYAVISDVTTAKVTYVSEDEIIAGGETYEFEDHNIADTLKKDDYVTVIYNVAEDCYDIAEVDMITGKVDGVKTTNGESCARIDGVWYVVNEETELALGNEVEFYAVNGVAIPNSAEIVSGNNIGNLVMVLDADNTNDVVNAQAIILFADGSKKTVTIDKDSAVISTGVIPAGQLYLYEETSDGYEFKALANTDDGKYTKHDTNTVTISSNVATFDDGTAYEVSDTAVIFVYTPADKKGAVITGKQLESLTVGTAVGNVNATGAEFYTSTVSGLTRVSYGAVALYTGSDIDDLAVTSGNSNYAYVTGNSYEVKLGKDTYETYTIWTGTENVTVFEKGTTNRTKHTVVKYDTIDAESIITGVKPYDLTTGLTRGSAGADTAAIQGIDGDNLYFNGTTNGTHNFEITSDTVYMYIDSNADKAADIGKAGGEVVMADKVTTRNIWKHNVVAVVNGNSEVVLLVIDVKNDMSNADNTTISATPFTVSNATVSMKTTGIKIGEAIEITVTATGAVSATSKTMSGAVLADNTETLSIPNMVAGDEVTFTIFAVSTISFT